MSREALSTFEREMQDAKFREFFEKGYREFSLSEILIGLMKENHKTVRGIQNVRSGSQNDLRLSNFLTIAEACGYHLCLEKGEKRIEI